MMTLIKERGIFDSIIEINKNGDVTHVICDAKGECDVYKYETKVSNRSLKVFDKNYYNVVRSDKKKCQEYTGW